MVMGVDEGGLGRFFEKQAQVEVAYLFGSQARGNVSPLSDVDVAVYFNERLSVAERFESELRIIADLSGILKTDKIDVVVMNDASSLINYEAIKCSRVLFVRDPSKKTDIEHRIMSEYLDRRFYDKRAADYVLDKYSKGV